VGDSWQLLEAWRAGDAEAGSALVGEHFEAISRFFRAKLGDDVEDIIQETFLACVEARDRIEGNFRGYLFGVATRRLFQHLRDRYKQRNLDFSVSSLADLRTTPSEGVARNQRAELIRSALRQLPLDAQLTLELAYWEGLSGAEIAAALDVEPGTVRSRLTRARSRLREIVVELGGDPGELFGTATAP
jgi:RNA polymerase sigma-70 factor (ECF subfamily)